MKLIRLSLTHPYNGAYKRLQDLMWYPLEWKLKHTYLTSSSIGQRRFSLQVAVRDSTNISIAFSCRLTPLFWTESLLLSLRRVSILLLSYFLRNSSFVTDQSTQTGVVISHSPISIRFCSDTNLASAPNSMPSISVLLQKCSKTCTHLCVLLMRSAPKRGYFSKALMYFRLSQSMWHVHISMDQHSGISSPR